MRALRNLAIIALLALIIDVAPGGGNAADAIVAALSLLFMALIGALCALLLLSRVHDRQIAALAPPADQKLWRNPRS